MYTYLNTELNRELSKLLHAKGLVSESDKIYIPNISGCLPKNMAVIEGWTDAIPIFTFEDCIRRENAIILWEKPHDESITLLWHYQSGGDWQTLIINHLKGEHNV